MKKLFTSLAIVLMGLCLFAQTTITITDGNSITALRPGKVVAVRVMSSVAAGTATLKAASSLPVVQNVAHYTSTTNFTYTYTYTNATGSVTKTVDYLPLPLGPTVTSYVTNAIVHTVTNYVPTTSSTVAVTNDLTSALTCSGGKVFANPENKYIFPGDILFFSGTAKGKMDIIIEE